MSLSTQGQIILALNGIWTGIKANLNSSPDGSAKMEFSPEIKNRYLPVVQPSTTKSVTFIRITSTNRQELGILGIKLLPNVQLIKQLVGRPYCKPPGNPSPKVIVGYCGGPFLFAVLCWDVQSTSEVSTYNTAQLGLFRCGLPAHLGDN